MEKNYTDGIRDREYKERISMLGEIVAKRIKNGEDPYKGKVIKAGNYTDQRMLEQMEQIEKINSILQSISPSIDEDVKRLVKIQEEQKEAEPKEAEQEEAEQALKEKLVNEILKKYNRQNMIDKDVEGEERE